MKTLLFATLALLLLLLGQGQEVLQCPRLRVFFELDASISIQQEDFNNEVSVVGSLINSIRHSTGSLAGYVPFDTNVSTGSLRVPSTDLQAQIARLSTLGLGSSGMTSFTNALMFANDSIFEITSLTNPQNVLVFMTDGIDPNADSSVLSALSDDLRNRKSTIIIAIGFGSIQNTNQLTVIANNPNNVLLFPNSQTMANDFQQIFANTSVCITVQLQPPNGLSTNNVESRQMTIQWSIPPSPVTEFRVCYSTSLDNNNICDNMVTAQLTSAAQIITNLSPFTTYRYAVISVNNNALQMSVIQSQLTAQEGSSEPVQDLAEQVLSFDRVTLTWLAPLLTGRNGIITEYEICYVPMGIENCQPLATVDDQVLTYTGTLMANTQYRARVSPLNGAAAQPRGMSVSVTFKTPQFPALTITRAIALSATEISVEWTSPSFTVNNYILTATNGNTVLTENPFASNTSFVIDNASPFTDYTIVLQANTNNGLNLPSQSVNVMTLEAAPSGPVVNLMAEGFTPTSIRINFTQPPMNTWNGILTSYLICVRDSPESACELRAQVDYAPTISHIFEGLRADTPYNVSVSPQNSAGLGPESIVPVRTAAAAIPPVMDLRGEQVGARQISVSWRNPPEAADTSIVGGIRVCYGMASIDCQFSVDLPRTQESVTLNITEPINPYYISVSLTTPTGSRGEARSIFVTLFIVEVGSLTTDAVSMNEIVASWTAPTLPIQFTLQSYSICVREENATECLRNFTVSAETLSIVIESLNASTQYSTSVSPVILEEFFIRDQTSSATTFPGSPDDAPQLVSVDFALRRALRISWTAPANACGSILTYEVVYEGTVVDTLGVRNVNATMGLMYNTILNLEEAEAYSIQVRARCTNGPGSLSVPVRGTTLEDAPSSAVTDLAARRDGDGVFVSYLPPILINRNGVITRYDILCRYQSNGMTLTNMNRVDGETAGVTLFNLPPQTTCNITVIPYTAVGPGPESAALLASTQSQVDLNRLCDDFRIGVSLVTILSAILIVSVIALITFVLVHFWINHRKPKVSDPEPEIYASPHQNTVF